MQEKKKEKQPKEKPLKIDGTLDGVLKVSVPKKEEGDSGGMGNG